MKFRFGYPEQFLVYAAILSFHSMTWSLSLAGASCLFAFFRFALEIQEKKEKMKEVETTAKLLNEQAEELGKALSQLFKNTKSEIRSKKVKYGNGNNDIH
tara:strand:- start:1655 stop:1954 length:300 start_codon:yes stop_codon:yes gene_type:complete